VPKARTSAGGIRGRLPQKIFEIGFSETPFSVLPGPDPDFITHDRNDHLFPIV